MEELFISTLFLIIIFALGFVVGYLVADSNHDGPLDGMGV